MLSLAKLVAICLFMRGVFIWLALFAGLATSWPAHAGTGQVFKVLPLFLDPEGRQALSPSLYDRDAYQAILRARPEKRSGIRFAVQWKSKGPVWEPLKLRLELRGVAQGTLPKQYETELPVTPTSWLGRWTRINVTGDAYKNLGEITAWRVTLWEGSQMLAEEKSFLW